MKWPIRQRKKRKKMHGGRDEEKQTTNHFPKRRKRQELCVQRDKGWIHVILVHDTTHLAVTTTRQGGNRRSRTTPHKERMRGLVKHRDYPPHSYIVNERYNSRNKRASQEKKTVNGKNRQLAQPGQTLTQGGHKQRMNKPFFIITYHKTNKAKLGK